MLSYRNAYSQSLFLILFLQLFLAIAPLSAQQTIQIGIITDFDQSETYRTIRQLLQTEIQKTVGSSFEIVFDSTNEVFIGQDPALARSSYQEILPRTDLVLILGSISIYGMLQDSGFAEPVVALGVFSTEFQKVPITEVGTSGIPNFTYIQNGVDVATAIHKFKDLADCENLSIIVDKGTAGLFDLEYGRQQIESLEDSLDLEINVVLLDSVQQALDDIPTDADGVLLSMPYELNQAQVKALADGLIEKKLPSYSITQRHVDQGILFSWGNQNDFQQLLRKVGIMIDDIVRGESLADMPVRLDLSEDLFMNIATSRLIEFPARFETIFTANLVQDEQALNATRYGLDDVIEMAMKENLDIKISYKDLDFSEVDVKQAMSKYLPDLDVVGSFAQIDKNSANPALFRAESTVTGVGSLNQIIYSEQVIAGIKIQRYLLEAQEYTTKQEIIDVLLDCYSAYLNVLQGKINLTIQQENLSNNKTNLEMAKLKSSLGAASNSDVYRFEGEVANSQQQVIEAQTNLLTLKMQLNNLLNNKLDREFDVDDIGLQDQLFRDFSNSKLAQLVTGPREMAMVMEFLVQESQRNYPSKNQLLANYKVLERQELMNKRMFYAPTVSASGQVNQVLGRAGQGADPLPGNEYVNNTWNLGLTLSYPIFDGNRRRYNLEQTRIQKEQMDDRLRALDNNLALRVRNNVLEILRSRTDIQFSSVSSENQQKNFELVQNNYQNGRVTITQLLDAQQASLQTKLNYSLSVYNFLFAFLQLENSIGFYTQLATEEENAAFESRLIEFLSRQSNE